MQSKHEYPNKGNGSSATAGYEDNVLNMPPPATRRTPFSRPAQGTVVDVILSMHTDLVEYGQQRAKASLDDEPNENDVRSLKEHAEAMAEEAYREAYNPATNEDHKLREAEYQKLQKDRKEAELTAGYAAADVLDLEEEVAKVQANMKPVKPPYVLMLSAVAGLALTIAPTTHDYIFITIKDDVTNWALSLLSAVIYGLFITWGLLDSDDKGERRTVRNWLGLAGGITVPVGLGLLRVANAIGMAEIVFAIALTVVEIGIVLLLEARSSTLRTAYQEWAAQQGKLKDVTTRLEAMRSKLTRRKQNLAEINAAIDAHIRLVEELAVRNFNIERIKADAIRSVLDGYYAGIAANRGRGRR